MKPFPMAHFGEVGAPDPDWVDMPDDDPDDEELAETPPYLIMMLGFDPKELADGGG